MMNRQSGSTRAETEPVGSIEIEVFRIQTTDNAEIAISHISPLSSEKSARPVILLHGTYSKRNFWISPKGIGLGPYLAQKGYDIWIPELRGHGQSPKGENFSQITAEDQIRFDIPAIQSFVYQCANRKTAWICHSFGGIYALASLSAGWLAAEDVAGLLTFGSQISKGEGFLKIPPVAWFSKWLLRRIGRLPAPALGMGPEVEAAEAMIEVITWKQFRGKWTTRDGRSYWKGLQDIRIPIRCFAAAADKNDPPAGCRILFDHLGSSDKTFILLGKKDGFLQDYDHVGMIVGKEAQQEIWPLIDRILQGMKDQ